MPGGGEPFRRFVVELPGAAMILAVDDQERAVVLRQYRHPVGSRLVEIPAGLLDVPGEDPLLAAQRELREEAALRAEHWQHLVSVHPSPGISTESHAIFLATGLADADRGDFELRHEEAEMSLDRVPVDDLIDAVLDGRVQRRRPWSTSVLAYDALRRRGRLPGQQASQRVGSRSRGGGAPAPAQCEEAAGEGRRTPGSQEPRVPGGDHPGRGARAGHPRPPGARRA